MKLEAHAIQHKRWPAVGRVILAHFDAKSVVVYQAYRQETGRFAAANGFFGGGHFSYNRMSWIKPNFLWMMYRCGWASKAGQEVVLAIRVYRPWFDSILKTAVPSSFADGRFETREEWQQAVSQSDVRLQWDPDHDPAGNKVERKAIQLGLRRTALEGWRGDAIDSVTDITEFVLAQGRIAKMQDWPGLLVPTEAVYPIPDLETRHALMMHSE